MALPGPLRRPARAGTAIRTPGRLVTFSSLALALLAAGGAERTAAWASGLGPGSDRRGGDSALRTRDHRRGPGLAVRSDRLGDPAPCRRRRRRRLRRVPAPQLHLPARAPRATTAATCSGPRTASPTDQRPLEHSAARSPASGRRHGRFPESPRRWPSLRRIGVRQRDRPHRPGRGTPQAAVASRPLAGPRDPATNRRAAADLRRALAEREVARQRGAAEAAAGRGGESAAAARATSAAAAPIPTITNDFTPPSRGVTGSLLIVGPTAETATQASSAAIAARRSRCRGPRPGRRLHREGDRGGDREQHRRRRRSIECTPSTVSTVCSSMPAAEVGGPVPVPWSPISG